jgi:cytochrome b subunit of formate dehydrogenase
MVFAVLNIVVALVLGFGAVQEFIVGGLRDPEAQPFTSLAGIVVSVLFIISGVAMWRKWPSARRLAIVAAISSIVFHGYAALPPHRIMGFPALIIGVGYGLVLLIITLTSKGKKAEAAIG